MLRFGLATVMLALSACELGAGAKKVKEGEACGTESDCSSGRCRGGFCGGPDCDCERGLQGCGTEPRTVSGCRSGWQCVGTPVTLYATGVCKLPCGAGCPSTWTCKSGFCVFVPPAPVPPAVTITAAPEELELGVTATFEATATAGDSPVESFEWRLGEGTTKPGATVMHAYSSVGLKTVQAVATDQAGVEGTASRSVRVCLPLMSECYAFDQRGNCCTGKRCRPMGDAGTRCQDP